MGAFGTVLPVTGLNNGYLGQVSRLGERVITARPAINIVGSTPIAFGAPVVIVPNATSGLGDTYQNIADYIAGGGAITSANINARFAGVANREVKTNVQFTSLFATNNATINSYQPGEMTEALERGSICVLLNNGFTPQSQGPVFVRVAFNGAIPTGVIGGFEGVADGANTVQLTGVVFRTGLVDANHVAEITILNRVAA
jgi:hypothetical protein